MFLPDWFPKFLPVFDPDKSYMDNAEFGPFFEGVYPERKNTKKHADFLGFPLASRLGVPAGPLLNSRWISFAAKMGFDILTYKTIRSVSHPGHPLPNILYVKREGDIAMQIKDQPSVIDQLTITNSFGMPSRSPEYLLQDIEKANRSIGPNQIMIVSVTATPSDERSFLHDFIETASLAKNAGAKLIEANFSCPNVGKKEGCLYMSPDAVLEYASKLVDAINPLPLILKVGKFQDEKQLHEVCVNAAKAGVRAISGLNSVSMRVVNDKKDPALGKHRETSGICGAGIRKDALEFTRMAHKIIRKEKLDLVLMGVGGIVLPEHFTEFFEAGADFALTATGMMWDPYLAFRYHNLKGEQ